MAKYKAKDSYKDSKNKYFQFGTEKLLIRGGTVQMEKEQFEKLPKEVREHLEEEKPKRARNKKSQLMGDNPDTSDINEAYDRGKAPKEKAKKTRSK